MSRHILVPLDGSPLAAAAVPYAVTLARAEGATISLLAVIAPLTERVALPVDAPWEDGDRQEAESTAYLASVAATVSASALAVTTVVRRGDPASAILAYAADAGCALVVMSTHGRTGLDRLRAGSVAQHVLRHAASPTLVVRPGTEAPTAADAAIAEITVTLDGSALAEAALPEATRLAVALAVPLTLLQVIPSLAYLAAAGWGDGYANYYPASVEQEAADDLAVEGYLAAVATRLHRPGLELRTRAERSVTARAEETIAAYLAARPTGLAVMASHGRGGVLRWVLGSTAEAVLDHAPCPLLIVRADATLAAERAAGPVRAVAYVS
jgi:nucleotide-binding universal stress UspA family protein